MRDYQLPAPAQRGLDMVVSSTLGIDTGDKPPDPQVEKLHSVNVIHAGCGAIQIRLCSHRPGGHRGREIDTAGDGFLAAFDGPARAVRCGRAIVDSVKKLGIHVRAGVHTGECEVIGEKLGGIAVHIGARIGALAAPDEVLVSRTVSDLVAGSGLRFEERDSQLKRRSR
jgi:hypothetical protein